MPSRALRTIEVRRHVILRQALEQHMIDDEPVAPRRLCHARVEWPVITRQPADERQDALAHLLLPRLRSCGIADCGDVFRAVTQLLLRDGVQFGKEWRSGLLRLA